MPLDPISWLIIGAIIGAGTVVFWDRIKDWATRVMGFLLDQMNKLVEFLVGGVVFLIKEGKKYYKKLYLYTRDKESQKPYRRESDKVEIKEADIPSDLRDIVPEKTNNEETGLQVATLKY
ncbi:hypothetical protein [Brasilonema bromeliae]|uniref:Uncharacterized protein n=1 Tax=Brasilonema bromeliae SPC951 TaxID=385972 RepID=A0ABX1PFI1_9CYAN|nr:hypothetical protein [Brasilonema bromeliae]NMG22698.1 hypothetical protein [Brasilonema bromeliae SPC951]